MSERCFKCFKPKSVCLCRFARELDTGVKFVFLMHPKEFRRTRTGTGYLAHICLKDSQIIVGQDFANNVQFQSLVNDPQYFPVLMYPGQDALNINNDEFIERIRPAAPTAAPTDTTTATKRLLIIILDATWFCARKLIQKNPFLLELPKLSFAGSYRSIFTFKREPSPECISTIECCHYIIKELQSKGVVDPAIDPTPLMTIFKEMIKLQLTAENERVLGLRTNSHDYDAKYNKIKELPKYLFE
ncbi:MAG: DTW domain-containing protein [Treponema sp.]|nr:DTW domain-containing protein [Treponema sp.]